MKEKNVLKRLKLFLMCLMALMLTPAMMSQVNMSRYIILTAPQDSVIKFVFGAGSVDNYEADVMIESGNNDTIIHLYGSSEYFEYTTRATEVKIYGNVSSFRINNYYYGVDATRGCVTSLDVSNNPELTELDCSNNSLTTLDVSNNPELTELDCYNNSITSLDVSNNPELTRLDCSNNSITSLDVSNNPELTELDCYDNSITSLDVSNNPELEWVTCSNTAITTLDVSNNPKLSGLACSNNSLTTLDVSNNPELTALYCHNNSLTTLDVSNNPELEILICYNNSLTTLDVSNNPKLRGLACHNNSLTTLDVSNNPELRILYFGGNQLTTQNIDNIYCSLSDIAPDPDYPKDSLGYISPICANSYDNLSNVLATNASNAISKHWRIVYGTASLDKSPDEEEEITGFTGTYVCGSITGVDNVEQSGSIAFYPNPVEDMLYINSDIAVKRISIHTITGSLVAEVENTDHIATSQLQPAVYIVKIHTAQGVQVRRIVKR